MGYPQKNSEDSSRLPEDAVLIEETLSLPRLSALSLKLTIGILLLLPLFLGGKEVFAMTGVKIICFSLVTISAVSIIRERFSVNCSNHLQHLLKVGLLGFLLGILQIIPLPVWLISFFSSTTASLYEQVGASWGTFSISRTDTLSAMSWYGALFFLSGWLTLMPLEKILSKQTQTLGLNFLDKISPASLIKQTIIISAVICSLIAMFHWGTGNETLFGRFGADRIGLTKRAHWPFVNPNHLSAFLEMSLILSFSEVLNEFNNLRANFMAERSRRRQATIVRRRKQFISLLWFSLASFLMIVCNVLTASRMGNVLALLGLTTLFFLYHRITKQQREATFFSTMFGGRLYHHQGKIIAACLLVVAGLVIIIIGKGGQQLAVERIEYGLVSQYDDIRKELIKSTIAMTKDFPLIGVGFGSWGIGAPKYVSAELAGLKLDYAHNDYLQLISEGGILAGTLLLYAFWLISRRTIRVWGHAKDPEHKYILATTSLALLLPLTHAIVDFPFHIPALSFTFVVLLALHLRGLENY